MWSSNDNISDMAVVSEWEARYRMFRPVTDAFELKICWVETEFCHVFAN
jgi:hypothetical protein